LTQRFSLHKWSSVIPGGTGPFNFSQDARCAKTIHRPPFSIQPICGYPWLPTEYPLIQHPETGERATLVAARSLTLSGI